MRLLPSEVWQLLVLVIMVGTVALAAGQLLHPEPPPEPAPVWPQVTRVIHPEDLGPVMGLLEWVLLALAAIAVITLILTSSDRR